MFGLRRDRKYGNTAVVTAFDGRSELFPTKFSPWSKFDQIDELVIPIFCLYLVRNMGMYRQ